jgi:hypothetical protein
MVGDLVQTLEFIDMYLPFLGLSCSKFDQMPYFGDDVPGHSESRFLAM